MPNSTRVSQLGMSRRQSQNRSILGSKKPSQKDSFSPQKSQRTNNLDEYLNAWCEKDKSTEKISLDEFMLITFPNPIPNIIQDFI